MRITLRPVREAHLEELYAAHVDPANRGAQFPLGVQSQPRRGAKTSHLPEDPQSRGIVKKIRSCTVVPS
jgi:hypothetical protein